MIFFHKKEKKKEKSIIGKVRCLEWFISGAGPGLVLGPGREGWEADIPGHGAGGWPAQRPLATRCYLKLSSFK